MEIQYLSSLIRQETTLIGLRFHRFKKPGIELISPITSMATRCPMIQSSCAVLYVFLSSFFFFFFFFPFFFFCHLRYISSLLPRSFDSFCTPIKNLGTRLGEFPSTKLNGTYQQKHGDIFVRLYRLRLCYIYSLALVICSKLLQLTKANAFTRFQFRPRKLATKSCLYAVTDHSEDFLFIGK